MTTPIRTSHFITLELILAAQLEAGDTHAEDEIQDVDIEDIKLNGKSIFPKHKWHRDDDYRGLNRVLETLVDALGDDVNEPLFTAANQDADW